MCSMLLPDGRAATLRYLPAGGADRRGEFVFAVADHSVPLPVPRPRFLALSGKPEHGRPRLSFAETTAFRLEDQLIMILRRQFDVPARDARVSARNLLWQMIRAHPSLVSFSTEVPRGRRQRGA